MQKLETVIDILKGWDDFDLVWAWTIRCEEGGYDDEIIEQKGDVFYVHTNSGDVVSFPCVDDDGSPFSYRKLAEFMIESGSIEIDDIDLEELVENFISEYFDGVEGVDVVVNNIIKATEFDLIGDDWNVLAENVRKALKG